MTSHFQDGRRDVRPPLDNKPRSTQPSIPPG